MRLTFTMHLIAPVFFVFIIKYYQVLLAGRTCSMSISQIGLRS